jgi:hypothetical protein
MAGHILGVGRDNRPFPVMATSGDTQPSIINYSKFISIVLILTPLHEAMEASTINLACRVIRPSWHSHGTTIRSSDGNIADQRSTDRPGPRIMDSRFRTEPKQAK